jgi:hypothetical protein
MPSAKSHAEQAERIVAGQRAAFTERAARGSYLHAASAPAYPKVETVEAVADRLCSEANAHARFLATPRGRFLACVDQLEEVGAWEEASRLRRLYHGSITLLNGPDADQAAIGEAILILNGIGTRTAREGVDALAELLIAPAQIGRAA